MLRIDPFSYSTVRQVHEKNEFGDTKSVVKYVLLFRSAATADFVIRPFIIDLESTNGTLVNDEAIPTSRYYELKLGDGMCSRRIRSHFTHFLG